MVPAVLSGLLLSGAAAAMPSWWLEPGERVENFALLDHRGAFHELYYHGDARAVVLMVQGNGCPISRNAWPRFRELRDEYARAGVRFLMINSNLQDDRPRVAREAAEFGIDVPILMDETQLIGESLGLVRTGEVLVVRPGDWTLAYRGALDDRLGYEVQKRAASRHYLQEALEDLLADRPVRTSVSEAVGCLINFPHRAAERDGASPISYSETVAPILIERCVSCHRPGGIGPWAMTEHRQVQGFAPMIREVVRTRRMPPWHADPAYGKFRNDRSLSVEEARLLVHWAESGAPRGAGPDPLAELEHDYPEWALGAPDLVIDIPPTEVPATGLVEYQRQILPNPLEENVWVQAVELLPGDPAAVHHVLVDFGEVATEGFWKGQLKPESRSRLGVYIPGQWQDVYAEGAGILMPEDADIEFEMHYTTYGKPTVDHSRLGLYFHKQPPRQRLHFALFIHPGILIPPHAKNHRETVEQTFQWDALVHDLHPHAHFRGKAMEFVAHYPDGSSEILLSVPNYDFNWQSAYRPVEPIFLPAGTRVVHSVWWDNSAQNPANPDPNRAVPFGLQTLDEMLYGTIRFSYVH